VILPNTTVVGASQVAEEIRSVVNSLEIAHAKSTVSQHVTLSLGIACIQPTLNTSPTMLIAAADAALYQAKEAGRNRYFPQLSAL
jgi:diguanylate cyclase (GGDEF)-like protein